MTRAELVEALTVERWGPFAEVEREATDTYEHDPEPSPPETGGQP